jgi:hypothetical protein
MTKKGQNKSWLHSTTQKLVRKEDIAATREAALYWELKAEEHRTSAAICNARAQGIYEALTTLGL